MSGPTLAEQARTALACARTGRLTICPAGAGPPPVTVRTQDHGGTVAFILREASPLAGVLAVRPLGTLRVAPQGAEPTSLHGTLRRRPPAPGRGLVRFALDVQLVRVGHGRGEPVDLQAYRAAEPDPLRHHAPAVLAHLRRDHGQDLTECLRAQGHGDIRWAEARRLDRYGLEVTVLDDDGAANVRLDFPTPVRSLGELRPGLRLALGGGTGDGRAPPEGSR